MTKTGTKEWATKNLNIQTGCENGCRYCYARFDAKRFGRMPEGGWEKPILREAELEKPARLILGRIMYPSAHDITLNNLIYSYHFIGKWLRAGNEVLIVSKPDSRCIRFLCNEFRHYKHQIVFRFTMGSLNNSTLAFWEPHAPGIVSRIESLHYAYEHEYETSVSIEPYLDESVKEMVGMLEDYVTDKIWIGLMNRMSPRVDMDAIKESDMHFIDTVKRVSSVEWVKALHNMYKDNRKVAWKDSIRDMLKLPEYDGVG